MRPDPYDLHAAVLTAMHTGLDALGTVYDGEVKNPPVDEAGRIQPYWVLWYAPGPDVDRSLACTAGAADQFQVTAAGMDASRCLWAVGRATAVLDGLQVRNTVIDVGVRWLPGYQAPPARKDSDVSPTRWFVPLLFAATAA